MYWNKLPQSKIKRAGFREQDNETSLSYDADMEFLY